ncbi:hypothetical protein CUR178_07761 [Leishmania enriettii]|uniref:Uncharacterized protein n=1 Tax=Leishmania enriettii TaxID=5663 RepID=A0A836KUN0_LEIEN|nr:hypothetical protein CUR178_07761 [Leishmania enriettii]
MSFEDPFANDLSRFRGTVAGRRRPSPSSPSSVSGGLAGGSGGSLGSASPTLPSGMGADPSVGPGAVPSNSALSSTAAASPLGPLPTSAPVAGRRAHVEPRAAAASLWPPAADGTSTSAATQATTPRSAEVHATSALPWLDDMDSPPPPVASATVKPSRLSAPPPPPLAGQALSVSSSSPPFLMTDAAQEHLPSFLDFGSTSASSGGGPVSLVPPRGAPAAAARSIPIAGGAATITADVGECRKKEVRDLYLTLDALDMELERLEGRIDDRQVKEETELLALETSVLVKTTELEEKEQELASKRAEVQGYIAERLEALASRYAKETAAQAAEVRSLNGARFEKQLQHVCDMRLATEQAVRELREQAALVLDMRPYSEVGVRLALFSAPANAAVPPTVGTDSPSSTADAAGFPSTESSCTRLESALRQAVLLLRGYCEKRLRHVRDNLVDFVHTSTLDAAHSVRRGREHAWMQDTVEHKQVFHRYMVDMMQRYMTFYKERALLKQDNISTLQADVRRMVGELRSRAAERLQQLLRDVTARIALSTQHHAQAAEEACALLQKKARTIVEGDMAIADAQRRELESRLLAEADARRRRHHAEEESLTEQLQRLRRSGEAANRDSFQAVRDAAVATSNQHAHPLREEVLALKTRLAERLRGGASGLAGASSAARMHAEELAHVVRSTVAQEAARQQATSLLRQRCDELRRGLTMSLCTDVVERLQQTRCVQHAHQARIDALAKAWEAARRQNLSAACSLLLPVSSSTADAEYASDTYAAPQDVMSTALLTVLQDKLRARDDTRRTLLASRRQCTTAYLNRLEEMRGAHAALQDRCTALWSATQTQATQQGITHDVELEVDKDIITVAAEQRVVDRDRRAVERECRRTAEMTSRLHHEAPPQLLYSLLHPSLQGAAPAHRARTSALGTVDINAVHKASSSNNTFTTVHASTNAATATKKGFAEASPPSSVSSSSSAPVALQMKPVDEAPAPSQEACRAASTIETSDATDTQPWSSALLRAEQRLPLASTGESCGVLAAAEGLQQGRRQSDTVPSGHHGVCDEAAAKESISPRGGQQMDTTRRHCCPADAAVEGGGGAYPRDAHPRHPGAPRDTASEKQRSGPFSLNAALPPVPSGLTADSATTQLARSYATMTSSAAPPAPPQRRQQGLHVGHPLRDENLSQLTWSTLEDYRSSSADALDRVVAGQNVPDVPTTFDFIATGSLEDSSNFVALLSCTDSPTSSSFTY